MARNNGVNMFLTFLVGGLVGAGVALLYAPYSGDKTRRKIMDFVEDTKDDITDYAGRIKSKIM